MRRRDFIKVVVARYLRRAGGATQTARGVLPPFFRQRWRPDLAYDTRFVADFVEASQLGFEIGNGFHRF
jgi:hypothetical protein